MDLHRPSGYASDDFMMMLTLIALIIFIMRADHYGHDLAPLSFSAAGVACLRIGVPIFLVYTYFCHIGEVLLPSPLSLKGKTSNSNSCRN